MRKEKQQPVDSLGIRARGNEERAAKRKVYRRISRGSVYISVCVRAREKEVTEADKAASRKAPRVVRRRADLTANITLANTGGFRGGCEAGFDPGIVVTT